MLLTLMLLSQQHSGPYHILIELWDFLPIINAMKHLTVTLIPNKSFESNIREQKFESRFECW